MARKKSNNTIKQTSMFIRNVPKMPEGYYSGDKPNMNLRKFVEDHLCNKPDGLETDEYDVQGFDKPLSIENRRDPYNDLHIYWSKKPYQAIREYIKHFTKPGDLVLDSYSGSGSTALAALIEGRKAIAIDRSPAATFITKNYCTPIDPIALCKSFEQLKSTIRSEVDWLYETRCDRCGGKAQTSYTVYSQVYQCPRCLSKVALYDCIDVEGVTASGKPKKKVVCPHCYKNNFSEEIGTRQEKLGIIPAMISYTCENNCIPIRGERRHNDVDAKKREYFTRYDEEKLREIEQKEIPYWYPTDRMLHAPEVRRTLGNAVASISLRNFDGC